MPKMAKYGFLKVIKSHLFDWETSRRNFSLKENSKKYMCAESSKASSAKPEAFLLVLKPMNILDK